MPNSSVQSFADPWEFQASMQATHVKTLLAAPGEYQSKLTRISMHRLSMHRAAISLPLVAQVAAPQGCTSIHFLADPDQAPIWQNGMELPPGVVALCASGTEHYCRTSTGVCWGSMSLTPEHLAAAGQAMVDRELTASAAMRLIRPPPHLMSRLLNLHKAAAQLAETVPDLLANPEFCRRMEHELVHVMVRCLAEDLEIESSSSRRQRRSVMRRFEEFLEANLDRSIYLPEICAAIGVSVRTLHQHCEEHVGMGAQKYLWRRRMNLARSALAKADRKMTTVTEIALNHGFAELGRFAVRYRELFGELPSTTLKINRAR